MNNHIDSSVSTASANAKANPICSHGGADYSAKNGALLGIHGKLQVMPTGHGVQGNGFVSLETKICFAGNRKKYTS